MKLGEVVVIQVYYNFTKYHQNWMKNKTVLLIARFSVQNFKVSVELWKSYIVLCFYLGCIQLFGRKSINFICWFKLKIFLKFFYCQSGKANWHSSSDPPPERRVKFSVNGAHNFMFLQYRRSPILLSFFQFSISPISKPLANFFVFFLTSLTS